MRQPSGFIGYLLTGLALVGVSFLSIARRGSEPAVSPAEYWVGMGVVGGLAVVGIALLARAQGP